MHDKNGNPLKDGDEVLLRCRITSSTGGATACNVTVEAVEDVEGEYKPTLSTNSRFFELASNPDSVHTDEQLAQAAKTVEERKDNVQTDEERTAARRDKSAK